MFRAEPARKRAQYYSIKDGSFRLPSNKEDPEAVRREYTNPKTKEDGVAYERVYRALYGVITDIQFTENTLGDGTVLRSINISLGEDDNGIAQIVSMSVDSRFTSDFLKKLPNIDLSREVRLMPYDFEPKEGPRQVGLSICHANDAGEFTEKVFDFFVKVEDKDGEKVYTNLHGYPEATDEDREDWAFFYKKANKFLISYTKQHILPKFGGKRSVDDQFEQGMDEVLSTSDEPGPIPF